MLHPSWIPLVRNTDIDKEGKIITLRSHLGLEKPWYCELTGHLIN